MKFSGIHDFENCKHTGIEKNLTKCVYRSYGQYGAWRQNMNAFLSYKQQQAKYTCHHPTEVDNCTVLISHQAEFLHTLHLGNG